MTPDEKPQPHLQPRPAVMRFADAMELKLQVHDHDRDGWEKAPYRWIEQRIHEELKEADACDDDPYWEMKYAKELVDVANFCMMFFDNVITQQRGPATRTSTSHDQHERLHAELVQELMGAPKPKRPYNKSPASLCKTGSKKAKFNANSNKKAQKGDVPNYMPMVKRDRK
jgi:hypothetical protein